MPQELLQRAGLYVRWRLSFGPIDISRVKIIFDSSVYGMNRFSKRFLLNLGEVELTDAGGVKLCGA